MNTKKVCAVLVSYNRATLLARALQAMYTQSRIPNHVLVIDNASTDDTDTMIADSYADKANFTYHKLAENLGGAGGFHHGVKLAYEMGFDWLWLMDDDGYPDSLCLQQLLAYGDRFGYFGPLVVSDEDKHTLSFAISDPTSRRIIRDKSQAQAIASDYLLPDVVIPFNGILLSYALVKEVGFPDERFFIWGDDMEYTYRIKKHGHAVATLTHTLFYHPKAPNLGTPMLFGRMQFNDTDSQIKLYCLCRNNTYNLKTYKSIWHGMAFTAKALWFYTFTRPSFTKFTFALQALWHGWHSDFSKHTQYIGKNFE
ncbi:MAG: glycosyltransferase family 2 protein [Moraxella sp.]|nr:glycosyltransferase family 2 protein [Moraxella sp.]